MIGCIACMGANLGKSGGWYHPCGAWSSLHQLLGRAGRADLSATYAVGEDALADSPYVPRVEREVVQSCEPRVEDLLGQVKMSQVRTRVGATRRAGALGVNRPHVEPVRVVRDVHACALRE